MASYRAVVSASGSTPSSRSRTATHARYWRTAPARSPAAARSSIRRTCADSSSGSRSIRRPAAAIAPARSPSPSSASMSRSSTRPTVRSTDAARAARQSSNSGLSRSVNPAMNGPRANLAAAARSAGFPEAPSVSSRPTSTSWCAGTSATCCRSTRRTSGPTAPRSTDSVRRRAPRAEASSASGHRSAASSSRP